MARSVSKFAGAALLLLLAACGSAPDPRNLAAAGAGSVLASEGVRRMRDAFNRGECLSIYDDASLVFQELEPRENWLASCEYMRLQLGSWQSFDPRTNDGGRSFPAHVDGTAVFAKGSYRLETVWNFEAGRARLFRMVLERGDRGMTLSIPLLSPNPRKQTVSPTAEPASPVS